MRQTSLCFIWRGVKVLPLIYSIFFVRTPLCISHVRIYRSFSTCLLIFVLFFCKAVLRFCSIISGVTLFLIIVFDANYLLSFYTIIEGAPLTLSVACSFRFFVHHYSFSLHALLRFDFIAAFPDNISTGCKEDHKEIEIKDLLKNVCAKQSQLQTSKSTELLKLEGKQICRVL